MTENVEPSHQGRSSLRIYVGAIVIALLLVLGFGLRQTNKPQPTVGNEAPDLALSFYDGYEWQEKDVATLQELRGEIVVLNFWASWCAPCRQEAAALQAISQEYEDRGVTFLGVAWSDTETKAYAYLQEFAISYPNAPDLGLNAQDAYLFASVPETFFIDADGVIQHFHTGPITEEGLRSILDQMVDS